MFRSVIFVATALSVVHNVLLYEMQDEKCEGISGDGSTVNLSVESRKDENGEWVTSFSACKGCNENSSKTVRLDVKQKVIQIGGKELIHIQGVVRDAPDEADLHKLKFFHRGGSLAVITNDGMTAFRENAEKQKDFACVFTNRPLKNNELFEVRVDRKIEVYPGFPMGIGITTHSPETMEMPGWMGQLKNGIWMLYDMSLLFNSVSSSDNYGQGYQKLKPGDKLGVMRTSTGTLHFFFNGVDEGIAATNIPYPVYGSVDLVRNIAQVSIVNKSPRCPT